MPNRIIKESFCIDKTISNFTDFEFRLWITLLLLCDDSGDGDARPEIIKGFGFPLCKEITVKRVSDGLKTLALNGGIELYGKGEKRRYKIVRFAELFPECGRHTKEYSNWRMAVFARDNYTCQKCGKRGGRLNAHHIKRYRSCVEERTNINNGITLCESCHRAVHSLEGK